MAIRRVRGSGIDDDTKSTSLLLASGLPGNPKNISSSPLDQENVQVSWSAPDVTAGGITGYDIVVTPTPTYTPSFNFSGTSASVGNLDANVSYNFNVRAITSFGTGGKSPGGSASTPNWNVASGGTETTYNIGPYSYKAHLFTGNSTLNVTSSTGPFEWVAGGGGGGGGANNQGCNACSGGTGVGGSGTLATGTVPTGSNSVTIGGGGSGGGGDPGGPGGGGGQTRLGSSIVVRNGGGGGGSCGPGPSGCGNGSPNGPQIQSTLANGSTNRSYSGGGGGGAQGHPTRRGGGGGNGSFAIRYKTGRISA